MNRFIRVVKRLARELISLLQSFIDLFKHKTIIYLIGDSTMCKYDASFAPIVGWGMPFADYFNSSIIIKNKARGGYSTKTFINQFFWSSIRNTLKNGNFVLIQFGHNDETINEPSIYTSPEEYGINLLKFVNETKSKSAIPILLTPVARRLFDSNGQIVDTHIAYSNTVRELAKQQNLQLIDLDLLSRNLLQQWGDKDSKMLFNYLLPNENPNYPEGCKDDEHFNEFGARKVAQLALNEIVKQQLVLADLIVKGRK